MHLAPTRTLHVFTNGNKRAEVQFVEGETREKYRTVTMYEGHVVMPYYFTQEDKAIERAVRYINNAS